MTNCHQLKLEAADGKKYLTDVANPETLLRLVQSVPSPKAEPIKLWLAKVGYERMQEMADPEKSLNRARENWKKHGRSEKWIQQRMMGQETRNKLTDYWSKHEITKEDEYAILTNIIHQEWSDVTVKEHKNLKGLKTQNLRDHMTEAELIFTALAELSSRQIADPKLFWLRIVNKILDPGPTMRYSIIRLIHGVSFLVRAVRLGLIRFQTERYAFFYYCKANLHTIEYTTW